jgi:glyoxylase-like metal-dependent hydrolase (beta-lactamase superfamily II)
MEALAALGVDATAVDDVVITHLHYDHAGCLDRFPRATFHLQAAEMAFATGPCMCHGAPRAPYTVDHVRAMVRRVYSGRVVFHDGAAEVAPGVEVHRIGGHSRGLQCVRVVTRRGAVVLASDASHFYENFETGKLFPIVDRAEEMLEGFATIRRLAGAPSRVVPGHDPLVTRRYPRLDPQTRSDSGGVYVLHADERRT